MHQNAANVLPGIVFCKSLYMVPDIDKSLDKVSRLLTLGCVMIIVCERILPEFPAYSIKRFEKKVEASIIGRADPTGNYLYEDGNTGVRSKTQALLTDSNCWIIRCTQRIAYGKQETISA